jgi:hypothetical protein
MRTTVTLDADVAALVHERMRERGQTFKQALNEALRDGLLRDEASAPVQAYETPTFDLGGARIDLDHALRLAASLEDDARIASARETA